MKATTYVITPCLLICFAACGPQYDGEEVMTKDLAQKRMMDGDPRDFCEEEGWYDDGVCDDFCPLPDPDCPNIDEGEDCPAIYSPVCGVDGETYGNQCSAAVAGVRIAHEGECEEPGQGDCFDDSDCADGTYCARRGCSQNTIGQCEPRPDVCTREFDPVCGCDGETYANACEAASAAVNVERDGECVTEQDCTGDNDCTESQYCFNDDLVCGDAAGQCAERPEICTEEFAPVCGCDAETYTNACQAASAGTNVASEGECGVVEENCEDNGDCGRAQYCAFEGLSCGENTIGACQERPDACPNVFAPVCGCDGRTYSNDCIAAAAGVNVESEGECEVVEEGCEDNGDCGRGQFCAFDGLSCGENTNGESQERPDACPQIFAPVCGCDGRTYSNDCIAAAAGVNVESEGECE